MQQSPYLSRESLLSGACRAQVLLETEFARPQPRRRIDLDAGSEEAEPAVCPSVGDTTTPLITKRS
jgi:hypothetical protein